MQNLLIVGIIVVIGIGGFILLQPTAEPVEDTVVVDDVQVETEPVANDIAADTQAPPVSSDIVETAVATPELSTLVTAVTQAELAATLQSDGPFTVFAPTNEAFAALPTETLETLLLPENIEDLQSVLTYHVVPGAITSDQLTDGMQVVTVNGETITFNVNPDGVTINGSANIAIADIETSNGVVHVIESVLLPPEA
jgi:uncharacterized surface protein with fasciclin (FAS1) repeats